MRRVIRNKGKSARARVIAVKLFFIDSSKTRCTHRNGLKSYEWPLQNKITQRNDNVKCVKYRTEIFSNDVSDNRALINGKDNGNVSINFKK